MKRLFNLKNSLISFLTFLLVFTLSVKTYAIEKPTYTKWIRELYDYDESVTDEKILEEKVFEDETGRVFYKQPSSLTYDTWDGKAGVIAIIEGFNINSGDGANYYHEDESIVQRFYEAVYNFEFDLSKLTIKPNDSDIVFYLQGNYSNIPYGSSTIAKVGCGPTSLAMILDSLLGTQNGVEGLINEIGSKYYVNGSGSSWALFNTFPKSKGLNVNTIHNHDAQSIVNALSAGHPIAMSCKKGDFTNGGHFIVLTGIDANGMITVNDPNSAKRSAQKWDLQTIMRNGTDKGGGWAMWEIYK